MSNEVELYLSVMAGQEEYASLRSLSYPDSDVVVLGYAIDWPSSLSNVQEAWMPELQPFLPKPIILVGCKKDLRKDKRTINELAKANECPVTYEEGLAVARKIGASAFLECSSLTDEGIWDMLHAVSWLAVHKSQRYISKPFSGWRKKSSKNTSAPLTSPLPSGMLI